MVGGGNAAIRPPHPRKPPTERKLYRNRVAVSRSLDADRVSVPPTESMGLPRLTSPAVAGAESRATSILFPDARGTAPGTNRIRLTSSLLHRVIYLAPASGGSGLTMIGGSNLSEAAWDVLQFDPAGIEPVRMEVTCGTGVAEYSQPSPMHCQLFPSFAGRCRSSQAAWIAVPSSPIPRRIATEREHSVSCGVSVNAATSCCSMNFTMEMSRIIPDDTRSLAPARPHPVPVEHAMNRESACSNRGDRAAEEAALR
jgi:hypothetical protein